MKKSTTVGLVVILVIVVALLGWYWWWMMAQSKNAYQAPSPNTQQTTQTSSATVVIALNATLGNYLVAANGMTLYKFNNDKIGVSNCAGQCAVLWPPYLLAANATLKAGAGISGTLGTITRADGTSQITYNGTPLYYWSKDVKPGDTTGQNFNGLWFVVNP
jgi:predicted lipoprotein with Yx(FWY)xxD motif